MEERGGGEVIFSYVVDATPTALCHRRRRSSHCVPALGALQASRTALIAPLNTAGEKWLNSLSKYPLRIWQECLVVQELCEVMRCT